MRRGLAVIALAATLLAIGCATNETTDAGGATAATPATASGGGAAADDTTCAAATAVVDAARSQTETLSSGTLTAAASDERVHDLATLYGSWVEELDAHVEQVDDPELRQALERIVSEFEGLAEMRSVEDLEAAAASDLTQLEAAFDEIDRACT